MRTFFTLALWLFGLPLFAQVWYRFFDSSPSFFSEILRTPHGYWIQGSQKALEVAPDGTVIGGADRSRDAQAIFLKRNVTNSEVDLVELFSNSPGYYWRIRKPDGSTLESRRYVETGLVTAKPASDSTFYCSGGSTLRYFTLNFRSEWVMEWEAPHMGGIGVSIEPLAAGVVVRNSATIARFDHLGQKIWETAASSGSSRGLKVAREGVYTIYPDPITAQRSIFLLDLANGAVLKSIPLPFNPVFIFTPLPNGDFAGVSTSYTGGTETSLIFRIDAIGNLRWQKTIRFRSPFSILADSDGTIVIGLMQLSSQTRTYLMRLDGDGNTGAMEPFLNGERILENNSMRIVASPNGNLVPYWGNSFLQIPKDSMTGTFFEVAPFIGGKSTDGNLHFSAATYSGVSQKTLLPGYWGGFSEDFKRVWLVKYADIERLRLDFALDGKLDGPIPEDIRAWPARNNRFFQKNRAYANVRTPKSMFSAPFKDANGDGNYDPYDGDYPLIKGDQMAWWVICDSIDTQAPLDTVAPFKLDIAFSLYTFTCGAAAQGDQVFFLDYLIRYQGDKTYRDAYLGQWADFDIGCPYDDYLGSMPDVNTMYAYNTDPTDGGLPACPLYNFPPENTPLQTITWLNQPTKRILYTNNTSGTVAPPGTGDPHTPQGFYNLLRGFWPDGSPLISGGDGKNGNFPPTNYMFPGNPAAPNAWSMCSANLGSIDRRAIATTGPMTFAPGDTLLLQTALMYHRDVPLPCPDVENFVKPTLQSLLQGHQNGALYARSKLPLVTLLPLGDTVSLDASLIGATAYLWSNGNTTPSIAVFQPGTYAVTITRVLGCPLTLTALVQSPISTGTPVSLPVWKVSPNPVQGQLSLSCPDCESDVVVEIYTPQGTVVGRHQGFGPQVVLTISDLPVGLYWVALWHRGAWIGVKKVVVRGE